MSPFYLEYQYKGFNIKTKVLISKTPLQYECFSRNLQGVQYLVGKGAKIEAKDLIQRAPFHITYEKKNTQLVEYLFLIMLDIIFKIKIIKTNRFYSWL